MSTKDGFKAERIVLKRRSRAQGPLVGQRVEVGAKCTVGDVYGRDVMLDSGAQAGRIFAENVTIGPGAVASEVTFTRSATIHPSAVVGRPPRQVSQLDAFPL